MRVTRSLRFQLVLGFVLVLLPLVLFILTYHMYAKSVVQDKISETYLTTLRLFAKQIDKQLLETNTYFYKMTEQDPDLRLLSAYPPDSDEYMLTKYRIFNKFSRDIGFYNMIDSLFLLKPEDMIFASLSENTVTQSVIRDQRHTIPELERRQLPDQWHLLQDPRMKGEYFLIRINHLGEGLYIGAIVKVADIMEQLDLQWNEGGIGSTAIYSQRSQVPPSLLLESSQTASLRALPPPPHGDFSTVTHPYTDEVYLVMGQGSQLADIAYHIIIPEANILARLPVFQKAVYFIPIGMLVIVVMYLLFMQKVMFEPLSGMIRGMKKVAMGRLEVRLKPDRSSEFAFFADTFNHMVQQIKHLKIGIYEEQLRVQQAEFNHLQSQINPHFFMNSLSAIYNFATLGDQGSVKKMALHLGDFFRFTMRANRHIIPLADELQHTSNYLEIQKLRFSDKLEFDIRVEEPLRSLPVPVLLIQPFVENSIVHGFKKSSSVFRITVEVHASAADKSVDIRITDNGTGFAPDILERLHRSEPLPPANTSRVGIGNIAQRIQLHYHGEGSLSFANLPGGGAVIHLRLPRAPIPADLRPASQP